MFEFRILGPVRLMVDGGLADLGAAKIRGLLGILLLAANSAVPIDYIVDRLWDTPGERTNGNAIKGREPPPNPPKTLQSYVSKLRAALDKKETPAVIRTESGYYRLQLDATLIDYHRFRGLVDAGRAALRRGDHASAVSTLTTAIELWRGDPLADVQSSWAQRTRESLTERELLPAHYGLFEAHLALHHNEHVLTALRPLLDHYETNEIFAGLRMRALAAVDGPGRLQSYFQAFSQKLRDVLGTEPADWLVALHHQLSGPPAAAASREPTAGPDTTAHNVVPRQLPRDVGHFVGRTMILRQLDDLFGTKESQPPIVALHGGPGTGKTALAIRWAHRQRQHFPDGELYGDLNGFGPGPPTSPITVLGDFLVALGYAREHLPADGMERAALLRQALGDRRILVILDNAHDSDHVRQLLAATSACPVLITSRQTLTSVSYYDGAHSLIVTPLMIDESIELLRHRIGAAREISDMAALHDLAVLCQGLPLGLRVASEHVAGRPDAPLRDLIEHLRVDRRLLDAGRQGDSGVPTLRAVFGWSCDALSADAEQLFCLLGIHPSTHVSAPAAASLAGRSVKDVERLLDVLIGAHLVHQQGGESYRMHDLVYLYAAERAQQQLSPDSRRAAVNRMVDWYLQSTTHAIEQISPQRPAVPSLPPNTSIDSLSFQGDEQAMNWCLQERAQIISVIQCSAEYGFYDHSWRLVATFADVLNRFGDPHDLLAAHRAGLDSARLAGARDGEAGNLNNLGVIYYNLGDHVNASRYFTDALAIFREIDDPINEAMALYNVGNSHLERGAYRRSISAYEEGLKTAERVRDSRTQAWGYHCLGKAYQWRGDLDRAAEYYQRALAIRTETADFRNQATTLAKLGELQIQLGNADEAVQYSNDSVIMSRRALDDRKTAEALRIRAVALYRLGAHDEAIASAQESVALCRSVSLLRGEARALDVLAQAQQAIGDRPGALASWTRAVMVFDELRDPAAGRIRTMLTEADQDPQVVPEPRTTPPHGADVRPSVDHGDLERG